MGVVPRRPASIPVLSDSGKLGMFLGALVGGVVFSPLHEVLAVLGWLVGGLIGGLVGQSLSRRTETEPLGLGYSFAILCLSLVIIGSEVILLEELTPVTGFILVVIAVATGIISLVVLLAHDSLRLNGYNFLLLLGLFGLLTITASPFLTGGFSTGPFLGDDDPGDGSCVNGNGGVTNIDGGPSNGEGNAGESAWRIWICTGDGRTLRYAVSEWIFVPGTTVPLSVYPDSPQGGWSLRSGPSSSNVRIVSTNDRLWSVTSHGTNATVSRWHLTAQNVSLIVDGNSVSIARELIVYGQGDIDSLSIIAVDRAVTTDEGQATETAETQATETDRRGEVADTPEQWRPAADTSEATDWWRTPLLVGYVVVVIVGGLLRQRHRD